MLYHLGRTVYLLAKRKMPAAMFPTWQDVRDAGGMIKYLLFLTNRKPKFGKYNFEAEVYVLVLVLSGSGSWS